VSCHIPSMIEQRITAAYHTALEPPLGRRRFGHCWAQYEADSDVISPRMLTADEVKRQRAALLPFVEADVRGRNVFEGVQSNGIYAMLGNDPIFTDLVTHPLQLAFAERELGQSCLLSACLAISLRPGETVQP